MLLKERSSFQEVQRPRSSLMKFQGTKEIPNISLSSLLIIFMKSWSFHEAFVLELKKFSNFYSRKKYSMRIEFNVQQYLEQMLWVNLEKGAIDSLRTNQEKLAWLSTWYGLRQMNQRDVFFYCISQCIFLWLWKKRFFFYSQKAYFKIFSW